MKLLRKSIKWGIVELASRPMYMCAIIIVPLFCAFFFLNMLDKGLPTKVPTAVVDLDQSSLSRKLTRNLGDLQMIDIKQEYNSYTEARQAIERGNIFAYFVIPHNFAKDVLSARQPQISYYNNFVYFVPGVLSFKNYETQAILASGAVISTVMQDLGISEEVYMPKIQPYEVHMHGLNNPWTNYNIYLSSSFVPCLLVLMIMIMTCYSLGVEIKNHTSVRWLQNSDNSVLLAVFGKLFPQTVIFSILGLLIESMLFGYYGFPLHCSIWHMISAMLLLVFASQSFALLIFCIIPNMRLSCIAVSLVGILSFSVAGFSFPVNHMYGAVQIFSYLLPIRYYFLIYIDQALNGIPIYYSRMYYVALLIYPLLPFTMLWKLKKYSLDPVYVQ